MLQDDLAALAARHGYRGSGGEDLIQWLATQLSDATQMSVLELSNTPVLPPPPEQPDRYTDMGLLGEGAMGEVRRVLDQKLNRVLAMKILRPTLSADRSLVARFAEEAQVMAQMEHPGLVPVHDLGSLPDGRQYFTMKEVRGRTLHDVLEEAHTGGLDMAGLRRLLEAFRAVADTVAFAHARGVVHRDLKPRNVMVADYGEVLVVDWGLAKVHGGTDLQEPVISDRSQNQALWTRYGAVTGTPRYMAPEQALGDTGEVDARCDVYALGAILYHVLSGHPCYHEVSSERVVEAVKDRPPQPLSELAPSAPPELIALAERCQHRDPSQRPANAGVVAAEVAIWLQGVKQREHARAVVDEALSRTERVLELRSAAKVLQKQAKEALEGVPNWAPETDKVAGWELQDQATEKEGAAQHAEAEREFLLQAALTHAPDLGEAHAGLAQLYREEMGEAEDAGRATAASIAELRLRHHVAAMKEGEAKRGHLAWLDGDGRLLLRTEPTAEVTLYPLVTHNRRLVQGEPRSLGSTPLDLTLPRDSYVLELQAPGHELVRYPVYIGRARDWLSIPPGEEQPAIVPLPPREILSEDERYVPPGWFLSSGYQTTASWLPRRWLWCDGLVFRRHPVTNAEFVTFLDDLVDQGKEEEALRWAPRERGQQGVAGTQVYGRTPEGRFVLQPDAEGHMWEPGYPVFLVAWEGARAYAAWLAARSGLPWRLPMELEWEKAASGVDGRKYVWGNHFDPSWCASWDSSPTPLPSVVGSYPIDRSVYGIEDMAGLARELCADPWRAGRTLATPRVQVNNEDDGEEQRTSRGGCWNGAEELARISWRTRDRRSSRIHDTGFRLVRSWPE